MRHLLRVNYQPAPAAAAADDSRPEPVHLQIFNDVYGPTLRRKLNAHLSELPAPGAAGEACRHCRPARPLKIRSATISGSVADRVGWLSVDGQRVPLRSDSDFLLELDLSAAPLRAERHAAGDEPCVAPAAVPGYYRLLRGRRPRCRHPGRRELAAGAVRDALTEAVRRHRPGEVAPTVSGPAVSFCDARGAVDCVPCVAIRADAAVPWLAELRARPRHAGWPEERLLAQLNGSLLLVPVGPHEDDGQLWRLSFSRQEALLVRALPPPARYCLMLLKAARMGRRDRLLAVSSYYLKTCVLWMCQEQSEANWRDPLTAMGAVLNMLRRAVDDGVLPSFFCEEINVLRAPTAERLAEIRRALSFFQENLLSLLHDMFCSLKPNKLTI